MRIITERGEGTDHENDDGFGAWGAIRVWYGANAGECGAGFNCDRAEYRTWRRMPQKLSAGTVLPYG